MEIEPIHALIGKAMRGVRLNAGVNQAYVAKVIGLTRCSVTNMEAGKQRIPLECLHTFCEHFDMKLGTLFAAIDTIYEPARNGHGQE